MLGQRWNFDTTGKDTRRKKCRRLTRTERVTGSILAARAEVELRRRELIRAQARVAEAKVHLARLQEIEERLLAKKEKAA